jgi:hypothetical protein
MEPNWRAKLLELPKCQPTGGKALESWQSVALGGLHVRAGIPWRAMSSYTMIGVGARVALESTWSQFEWVAARLRSDRGLQLIERETRPRGDDDNGDR